MEFLRDNWFWIVVVIVFILMHAGHGGHGGHGGAGRASHREGRGQDDGPEARDADGHRHH